MRSRLSVGGDIPVFQIASAYVAKDKRPSRVHK